MLTTTTTILSLLPLLTAASPFKRQAPIFPPTEQSGNFNLIANVTSANPQISVDSWVVSSYHVGAGQDFAVLTDPSLNEGRIFFVNGTAEDVRFNNADLLSLEGTPLFPAGWSIDPETVTAGNTLGEHTVHINAGLGQPHISLAIFPNPVPFLTGPDSGNDGGEGGYYACNNNLPFGPATQLLYKYAGEVTPAECVDVTLLPQCVENGPDGGEFGNVVQCYADVAAIDWTVFTA